MVFVLHRDLPATYRRRKVLIHCLAFTLTICKEPLLIFMSTRVNETNFIRLFYFWKCRLFLTRAGHLLAAINTEGTFKFAQVFVLCGQSAKVSNFYMATNFTSRRIAALASLLTSILMALGTYLRFRLVSPRFELYLCLVYSVSFMSWFVFFLDLWCSASILDTSERVGHHFSHEVIGLESRVFIVRREGLLYCSIVVAVYDFHIHVFKLVAFLVILRLLGSACS